MDRIIQWLLGWRYIGDVIWVPQNFIFGQTNMMDFLQSGTGKVYKNIWTGYFKNL